MNNIQNNIQMASVSLPGKDEGVFPACQVTAYGQASDVIVLWPYGMHGSLPEASYTVSFTLNGQQENRAVIGYRPDLRPKGKLPGEIEFGNFVRQSTTFYNDAGDIVVNCEHDEIVTIKGASTINIEGDASVTVGGSATIDVTGETTLTTPKLTVDGNVDITGTLDVGGASTLAGVTSNGTNVGSTHAHSGVQSGGSNTGAPV